MTTPDLPTLKALAERVLAEPTDLGLGLAYLKAIEPATAREAANQAIGLLETLRQQVRVVCALAKKGA